MVERVPLLDNVQGAQPRQTHGAYADEGLLACAGGRAARRRRHAAGVWAAGGGGTRRSNAPGVRGTLQPHHGANTAKSPGRETSRRGPGHGNQPDVGDPTERRDA
jgi:hypothetical protein